MHRSNMVSDAVKLASGFAKCKEITKRYGTSFYFATQFFPAETRLGIYAVYAFARIPDEIVDDPHMSDKVAALAELRQWRTDWLAAMERGESDDEMMNAIVWAFKKYKIPVSEGEAFLKSMFMDEDKREYGDRA